MSETTPQVEDKLLMRPDLCKALNISSETLRRWLKAGKIPKPDIAITRIKQGWKLSSLHAANIMVL